MRESAILRRSVLVFGCLATAIAFAQDATVTGIVTDTQHAVVPGVQITVRNADTGITRTMQTGPDGGFTITSLPPGPGLAYVNAALMKNFRIHDRENFQFRFESFNLMNHPNFLLPAKQFNATQAGLITGVQQTGRGGARVFQASLKFEF